MDNRNYIELNRYICGDLLGSDKDELENLLNKNKMLQEEIKFHKEVDSILTVKYKYATKIQEFKITLKEVGEQYHKEYENRYQTTENTNSSVSDSFWKKATTVLKCTSLPLAASLIVIFWPPNLVKIANKYHKPVFIDLITMGENQDKLLIEAQTAYDNNDCKKAIPLLAELADKPITQLAKGDCEYRIDETDSAIATFEKIISDSNPEIITEAYWYLSLTHLKNKDKESALKSLKQITPNSKKYYTKAQKIIRKID